MLPGLTGVHMTVSSRWAELFSTKDTFNAQVDTDDGEETEIFNTSFASVSRQILKEALTEPVHTSVWTRSSLTLTLPHTRGRLICWQQGNYSCCLSRHHFSLFSIWNPDCWVTTLRQWSRKLHTCITKLLMDVHLWVPSLQIVHLYPWQQNRFGHISHEAPAV